MNIIKIIKVVMRRLIWAAIVVALISTAYWRGVHNADDIIEQLAEEKASLQKTEYDATVVRRVSQQMEDIAYQQKAISDEQREHAVQQRELAEQERGKAEIAAREAEEQRANALAAAREAEKERSEAEKQADIARTKEREANLAKSRTDTLNYRTIARTLGSSAMSEYNNGSVDRAKLLAYTSYYFLSTYKGNQYQSETFKSVSLCTGSSDRYMMQQRGQISGLANDGTHTVAVSNYGEVQMWDNSTGRSTVLFHDKAYNFVDVAYVGDRFYALADNGSILTVTPSGKKEVVENPHQGSYKKIVKDSNSNMLLMEKNHLVWFDPTRNKVGRATAVSHNLSAAVKRDNVFCLFFSNGKYAEMTLAGMVTYKEPLVAGTVTACCYDAEHQSLFLGFKRGNVSIFNKYNMQVTAPLLGHISSVTSIDLMGDLLVSGAYDKSAMIWKLTKLQMPHGYSYYQAMQVKDFGEAKQHQQESLGNAWLTPVIYSYDGWVQAVCCDAKTQKVYIGTSTGLLESRAINIDDLASQLFKSIKANWTLDEWHQYVGTTVPYVKFK